MKITVNFDHNWTNDEIKSLINNPNLTARDLEMDINTYLEVLVVAAFMKKHNLSMQDAADAGCIDLASGIEDYYFEEMFDNYVDHYRQILRSEI